MALKVHPVVKQDIWKPSCDPRATRHTPSIRTRAAPSRCEAAAARPVLLTRHRAALRHRSDRTAAQGNGTSQPVLSTGCQAQRPAIRLSSLSGMMPLSVVKRGEVVEMLLTSAQLLLLREFSASFTCYGQHDYHRLFTHIQPPLPGLVSKKEIFNSHY